MTTQEFADNVVQLLDEQGYFKKGERVHPEDIVIAFGTTAESFARGVGVAGSRVSQERNILQK